MTDEERQIDNAVIHRKDRLIFLINYIKLHIVSAIVKGDTVILLLLGAVRGVEYCDQTVCLFVREHISGTAGPIFTNFLCRCAMAVALSLIHI